MKDPSDKIRRGIKIAKAYQENDQSSCKPPTPYKHAASSFKKNLTKKSSRSKEIAIFVALEMERDILQKSLGLQSNHPDLTFSGNINFANITLYCPGDMGRVPAAISTMAFLADYSPDLLIVAGIAGGFEEENINLGDVIIAKSIADLASRKITENTTNGSTTQEFRPKEFFLDKKILNYISHKLDTASWEQEVLHTLEWPNGKRPTIRSGTLASLDEVISSDEWRNNLLKAWPKLKGIEMEAGGVCAAAHEKGIDVSVIRGVSGLADPAKSDDHWRKLSMQTVGILIKQIDFNAIFATKKS
ncbi:MAG: 5'-methylthioadenosine/S-adenosylhomocysteine nucleosidase [Desulfobacteraceae bacterium]|nr:5'-methylthioadenosine/S-adenosylhomocysteine nucleosidase [Desulfobacteraceae bacterium]MBC2721027.1 hypothetical protein [Desulfobacteraceae bacterium]